MSHQSYGLINALIHCWYQFQSVEYIHNTEYDIDTDSRADNIEEEVNPGAYFFFTTRMDSLYILNNLITTST